jgi:methylglutaconyl-CoA hydratase
VSYRHLISRRKGPIKRLTLNRPDVRNAFNEEVIAELTEWAEATAADKGVRVVVLDGEGPVFCAGADLAWMSKMATYTHDENVRDATAAAAMYGALDRLPMPLIGRIHGAALGGGAGLAAVCDIVVADERAVFGFTEVKLGIVPAMISPFVVSRIGQSAARELFVTGMRFSASRAREIGLVHAVVPAVDLDVRVAAYISEILAAAPEAVATAKDIIRRVAGRDPADVRGITAETLAVRRASPEGREGMRAFFEKRKASWDASPGSDR